MAFPRHISAAVDFLIQGSDRWLRKALHTSWPAFPQSQLSPGGAGPGIHARKPVSGAAADAGPQKGRWVRPPPAGRGDAAADREDALPRPRGRLLPRVAESREG